MTPVPDRALFKGGGSVPPHDLSFTYTLFAHEVPAPPSSPFYLDKLRWLAMVMDPDDPDLAFVCSVLAQGLDKSGLTEKQEWRFERINARVLHVFGRRCLLCQMSTQAYARRFEPATTQGGDA